jgi:5-methylcytosine-specific restriction endonuclease McrA
MTQEGERYRLATAASISAKSGHSEDQFIAMITACNLGSDDLVFVMERFRHYASQQHYRSLFRPSTSRPKGGDFRHGAYIRAGTLGVEETFDRVRDKADFQTVFGVRADFHSWRLMCYESKGVTCVECGLTGNLFAVERGWAQNTDKYHLNLYCLGTDGHERMMTVDHILPRSKGGGNDMDNLQPMCFSCNVRKGDKHEPGTAA